MNAIPPIVRPLDSGRIFGSDACRAQIGQQQVQTAKRKVAIEDMTNDLRFGFNDGDLAILGMVAERHDAADPQPLPLGGTDLVADPLGRDLALELRERQQHVQCQAAPLMSSY